MHFPPLKRPPALQPLSREHMSGLIQARNLIAAAAGPADQRRATVAAFLHAWETELVAHFQDEETLLSHLITPEDRERLIAEHAQLRELAARLIAMQTAPTSDALSELGALLHDHIRWEERELFPSAEGSATAADFESLAAAAARIEADRPGARARHRL